MTLLSNKVAIITGAASGIGLDSVRLFLDEGAQVVAGDINVSPEILAICEENNNCFFTTADVTFESDHQKMIDLAIEKFGKVDICFNNAGIIGDTGNLGADQDMNLFDTVFNVNVRGVALAMNKQIKYFLSAGIENPAIINTSSIAGKAAVPGCAPYIASKHAVVGLTKTYAVDYAKYGIRINMVAPGVIATPMITEDADEERAAATLAAHPIGRIGLPREISELVAFLGSDRAGFINGAYYNVDGGYLAI
ncbi:SDR family NAD(P)-dependent oxidoreductase [Vibrio jasicida]|uniref:SDR family NAD(P)-dependent oxidoreductase n=1 Tax=Vibrio jasicida TaxID=766224 RepID=UPI0015E326D1|nr:SDR family oxidoreductase [Vibrio jasicida]